MITYNNISGTAETSIIPIITGNGKLSSISIANTHTHAFGVTVFLKNAAATKFYVIKGVSIPPATTLVLDDDNVFFNSNDVGLFVQLAAASSGTSEATVITKIKTRN
tara:strand:+ start:846 stop:1166 length:321 start_codon:yes stop_codon:yes gene_type:complete